MKWTLEEFSNQVNLDEKTIVKYIDLGLISGRKPGEKVNNFDETDKYWFDLIQCFISNGSTLDDLRSIIGHCQLN
ncbi:MerR family transcriptional regulator [Lentilactobacillus laojiaonis]|uniref:MerR family transcriptional regulator n=1 Tax=Lentilactobacillus laojiaonis TaxID=2883998 RepID=UPI001D0AF9CE|nr:MerR family transcriptional regulator [Lentilactobacillus laojiaonis]UDM32340.1 transcriptional regulator [Lentilactobacillus laojiaonis]